MTPAERAKWCIAQAEEIERDLPPQDPDETFVRMDRVCAAFWREMAFRVAGEAGRGAA